VKTNKWLESHQRTVSPGVPGWLSHFKYPTFSLRFIYFEREHARAWVAGQTAEGERILTRLHAERRARGGARTHDPEITTRAETKSPTLNQLSHPGAPIQKYNELNFEIN